MRSHDSIRAVGVTAFGDQPTVFSVPLPAPGPDEVRIAVAAATVNPADLLFWRGDVPGVSADVAPPYIGGLELSGVVDAIGGAVSTVSIGERVAAITRFAPGARGAHAEHVLVDSGSLMRLPHGTTFPNAATVPMNGMTALQILDALALPPGSVLAVTGAAGALGGYLVDLGRARGFRVMAIGRPSDTASVMRLGATWAVEGGADVVGAVRAVVTEGVDGLVDAALIGPAIHDAVRDAGTWVAVRPSAHAKDARLRHVRVSVSTYTGVAEASRRLEEAWHAGALTPRVARTLPASQVAQAVDIVATPGVRGRVVLDLARW